MELIAFDSHKKYTQYNVQNYRGETIAEGRIPHEKGAIRLYLSQFSRGSPVAVETIGNWYWIVDEIESAGMIPQLVHARKAKLMMGMINKTDKLDARGLNKLQRVGVLPVVWIPPAEIRDKRDLTRTRMFLSYMRTRIKNRIHSVLAKYGLSGMCVGSDIFSKKGRRQVELLIRRLPPYTEGITRGLLSHLEELEKQIKKIEDEISAVMK